MWVERKTKECKSCGTIGGLFYAFVYTGNRHPHLKGRIYERNQCRLCFLEDARKHDRKHYNQHKELKAKKFKDWEEKNRERRNKYKRERYKKSLYTPTVYSVAL